MRFVTTTLGFALSFALVGCGGGPAIHPVEGTVRFKDGTPAVGCTVEFRSGDGATATNASGDVGADGKYKLTTFVEGKPRDGAVAGPNRVIVVGPPSSSSGPPPLAIPIKYADYATSGLSFDVKPGPNEYNITLEKR